MPFCSLPNLPINVGKTEATYEAAINARRGEIELAYCPCCDLVHNIRFSHEIIGFEPGYQVALHHSKTFRDFINSVADRLIAKYKLHNKRILDIGCGDGYFLETLCKKGANYGVGIDPTIAEASVTSVEEGTVERIPDLFTTKYAQHIGDMICCQSVFEDIPKTGEFLRDLRQMIGDRNVPVYFEVFNGFRAFENEEIWSIHYEQCNYFNLRCLTKLFESAGFTVTESGSCYQSDQYLYVESVPSQTGANTMGHANEGLPTSLERFARLHADLTLEWNARFKEWKEKGTSVVMWGSGGKTVSFLNSIDTQGILTRVVDINPDRQNTYLAGSGQRIDDPSVLASDKPDVIILSNSLYQKEITSQAKEMGVECDFLVA